jgi:hypothetical protein
MSKIALCLYGRFGNRNDPLAGLEGFAYLKKRVLDKADVDVFIFSFDVENAEIASELYLEWTVEKKFTATPNFDQIARDLGIKSDLFKLPGPGRDLEATLAFLFQRSESIKLMLKYSQDTAVEYDQVITSRFDLAQVDKHNGHQPFRVSEIGPIQHMDTSAFTYMATWNQMNEGIPDQWFVTSSHGAKALADSFSDACKALAPGSRYADWAMNGITDSNSQDLFSNEKIKLGNRLSNSTRSQDRLLDNHLLHKFLFIESGLYESLRPAFDGHGIAQLVYTHSDYADLLPIFYGQQNRVLGSFEKNYLAIESDSQVQPLPAFVEAVYYDERKSYTDRLLQALDSITEEYLFFSHEDMPLTKAPEVSALLKAKKILESHAEAGAVRFIRVGRPSWRVHLPWQHGKYFVATPWWSRWLFSIQPTLWKRQKLIALLRECPGQNIWDFEVKGQSALRKLKIGTFQPISAGKRKGKHHRDSQIFPYIATAIVKGKWNFSEYPELKNLLDHYSIEPSVRGKR